MKVIKTDIPDVLIIEPEVFGDDRGFFYESYNRKKFSDLVGVNEEFVQDNHSRSAKNVLRGMHYQINKSQGKLVRVTRGEVFDVVVDIRKDSPTFGKWVGFTLSEKNKRMLWIPKGFAHGFLTLMDDTEFLYKTTDFYSPENERCIHWKDPDIDIKWPLSDEPVVSEKDESGVSLKEAELFA